MWFLSCLNKSSNTQYALTCKAVASIYYPGKKWVHLNLVRWRHHSQDPPSGVFHSGWNSRGDCWDVLWLPPEWCCHKLVKINICFGLWISILSEFSAVFLQLDSSLETSANSAPVPSYNAGRFLIATFNETKSFRFGYKRYEIFPFRICPRRNLFDSAKAK